jgi:signal transduction histidine kinase/ActR/RegA family two-component response regulator
VSESLWYAAARYSDVIVALLFILFFGMLASLLFSLHQQNMARKRAQAELKALKAELDLRVAERTGALREDLRRLRFELANRQYLEKQLRQGERVEPLGRLAGGIAHDFNNLLTIITGNTEILLGGLPEGEELHAPAQEIMEAAERAAWLTRQLLSFSRQQVLEPQALDLNAVVNKMNSMLPRLISEDIEFEAVLEPTLDLIKADPGEVEQVILNLAVNARDAMPQGGKIILETANVMLDGGYVRDSEVQPGHYVMLSVTDTGCGMTEETQAHIFEPFFTTKETGKGTGLGLATVYRIVRQAGGYIWVSSALGKGTTFKIFFPRSDELPAEEMPEDRKVRTLSVKGTETVLLVEDQDRVRALVHRVLKVNGYRVLEAANGQEALDICEKFSGPIHLLLTDVVMPGMGGPEVAKHLAPFYPEMKVLYISGYTDGAIASQAGLQAEGAFLPKPFTQEGLLHKVREVLEAQPEEQFVGS